MADHHTGDSTEERRTPAERARAALFAWNGYNPSEDEAARLDAELDRRLSEARTRQPARSVQSVQSEQIGCDGGMEQRLPLTEARARLSELVNRARFAGETTYITSSGTEAAAVVPAWLARRYAELEDLDDAAVADQRLADLDAGQTQVVSAADAAASSFDRRFASTSDGTFSCTPDSTCDGTCKSH
jgi:antitoxin Phd